MDPAIDGTRVVWADYYGGTDASVRTMMIDGSGSANLGAVAFSPLVLISGNRLAWIPPAPTGNPQLLTWSADDPAEIASVTVPANYVSGRPQQPQLSGDRFAWFDIGDPGYSQIITRLASDPNASVIATGQDIYYAKLAGDTLGWLNTAAGVKGIWVAHRQAAPGLAAPAASPSKPKHGATFTIKGNLASADPSGGTVTLRIERKAGKKWALAANVTAKLASNVKAYSAKTRLAKRGAYRVRASHAADFAHTAGTSSWKTFSVS